MDVYSLITERVIETTERIYKLTPGALIEGGRTMLVFQARAVAMLILRQEGMTLMAIGAAFGRHDHKTVLNAIRRAQQWIATVPLIEEAYQKILAAIPLNVNERIIQEAIAKAHSLGLPATDWRHFLSSAQRQMVGA